MISGENTTGELIGPSLFLIGNKGAGKTCFLAGISIFAQTKGDIFLSGADEKSKNYLQVITRALLEEHSWPRATSGNFMTSFYLQYKSQKARINILEYAGEILAEFLHGENDNFTEEERMHFLETLGSASHVLLVLDGINDFRSPDATDNSESDVALRRRHELLLDFLGNLLERENKISQVAILLTKCDRIGVKTQTQARKFIISGAEYLYEKVKMLNDGVEPECLAFSVCGEGEVSESGSLGVPSPFGCSEVFDWFFGIKVKARRSFSRAIYSALVIAFLSAFGWLYYTYTKDAARSRVNNPNVSLLNISSSDMKYNMDIVDTRIDGFLASANKLRENNPSLSQLQQVEGELRNYIALDSTRKGELKRLQSLILEDLDRLCFNDLEIIANDALKNVQGAKERFIESREKYRPYLSEASIKNLDAILLNIENNERDRLREDIRAVRLNTFGSITKKAELINKYVNFYIENDASLNMEEIKKAIGTAHRLTNAKDFNVSLQSAGKFAKPRIFRVIVDKGGISQKFSWSKEKTTEATWNEEMMVQWEPFDTITVKIEIDGWTSDFVIRTAQDSSPLSLRILGGNIENWLNDENYEKYSSYIDQSQNFSVRFSIKEFAEEDWELLAKYFYPGDFWK
jgi:hypothetical protein